MPACRISVSKGFSKTHRHEDRTSQIEFDFAPGNVVVVTTKTLKLQPEQQAPIFAQIICGVRPCVATPKHVEVAAFARRADDAAAGKRGAFRPRCLCIE